MIDYIDEEDNILSTDMYVNQERYDDIYSTDDVEYHIPDYNPPKIDNVRYYNIGPWEDDSHLVFDVPKQKSRY